MLSWCCALFRCGCPDTNAQNGIMESAVKEYMVDV